MKKEKKFNEITEKVRDAMLSEFDQMAEKKEKGELTENDFDFYLARDRKAAIILKTLQMDMQHEVLEIKHGKILHISTDKK